MQVLDRLRGRVEWEDNVRGGEEGSYEGEEDGIYVYV